MNQGRIWCVVNPTVGLPLFLGSVAVTALAVHYSVLSHTNWFSNYWQGSAKGKAALLDTTAPVAAATTTGERSIVINLPQGMANDKGEQTYVLQLTLNSGKADATVVGKADAQGDPLALAAVDAK
jgi:light-harvesting protein B-800-850 alpha chain